MFRSASALIVNKIDLVPYLQCDPKLLRKNALQINPQLKIFETSCKTNQGISGWAEWLISQARLPT
jgi:hydrogenase nickel incorporation protein HypB